MSQSSGYGAAFDGLEAKYRQGYSRSRLQEAREQRDASRADTLLRQSEQQVRSFEATMNKARRELAGSDVSKPHGTTSRLEQHMQQQQQQQQGPPQNSRQPGAPSFAPSGYSAPSSTSYRMAVSADTDRMIKESLQALSGPIFTLRRDGASEPQRRADVTSPRTEKAGVDPHGNLSPEFRMCDDLDFAVKRGEGMTAPPQSNHTTARSDGRGGHPSSTRWQYPPPSSSSSSSSSSSTSSSTSAPPSNFSRAAPPPTTNSSSSSSTSQPNPSTTFVLRSDPDHIARNDPHGGPPHPTSLPEQLRRRTAELEERINKYSTDLHRLEESPVATAKVPPTASRSNSTPLRLEANTSYASQASDADRSRSTAHTSGSTASSRKLFDSSTDCTSPVMLATPASPPSEHVGSLGLPGSPISINIEDLSQLSHREQDELRWEVVRKAIASPAKYGLSTAHCNSMGRLLALRNDYLKEEQRIQMAELGLMLERKIFSEKLVRIRSTIEEHAERLRKMGNSAATQDEVVFINAVRLVLNQDSSLLSDVTP